MTLIPRREGKCSEKNMKGSQLKAGIGKFINFQEILKKKSKFPKKKIWLKFRKIKFSFF